MSAKTGIEWTDATWNPVRGCSRVSAGCVNCYAERFAARFSGDGQPDTRTKIGPSGLYKGFVQLTQAGPRWTGKVELIEKHLADPLHWKQPKRIFVNSMSDLFHEALSDEAIDRVFAIMALCPQHTFQALTKRPKRMLEWATSRRLLRETLVEFPDVEQSEFKITRQWPVPNVWLGVSVEDRARKDRIDILRQTPAAIRFLSLEPLLEDIGELDLRGIDWVIAGGESGPGARPAHPDWFRSIRDQCQAARVPFFFKQWGAWTPECADLRHLSKNRWSPQTFAWGKDGREYNPVNPDSDDFPKMMFRVGKKAAGALLDGRAWRQFPEVRV